MRKIINFTHATLDGYIDNPQEWWLQYIDDELQDYELQMHLAADALLLGRITFEGMAQAWPAMGDHPFAAPSSTTSTRSPTTSSPRNRSTPRCGIRPWSSQDPTWSTRSADSSRPTAATSSSGAPAN